MKEHSDGLYQGQLNSKSQKHGIGIYLWDVGYAYYGEWKNDFIDGQGILFLGGQIIIQGGFRKGVPQGYLVIKVGTRVFYSQFNKGEAIFIQEGEKRIIVESSTAQITHDCTEEADKILQQISKLGTGELQIQLFNHCLYYGAVGKANLPNGLGVEISSLYFQCGQFSEGKMHGIGRLEQAEEIYQGQFQQGKYNGNGLFVFKDDTIQWIKGIYRNGQLVEIKKTGPLEQLTTPVELVCKLQQYLLVPLSKKTNHLYTVTPISKEIVEGYVRLFEVMQFVRLRVNTLTSFKQPLVVNRKMSNNVLSKSVEEIKKLQSQFSTRKIQQQNQIYEIILNQHDDNETQRKVDTQQSRMKTQPAEEYIDNKISFGMLDVPNYEKRQQNEVQSNNDRMLTLKNILEAQKSKYSTESAYKKTVFTTEAQTTTAAKSKALSQDKNLKCLSEVVQKELNRSPPSDERRSTIKPTYESETNSQKPGKFSTESSNNYTSHKNKINTLLNRFNNIKIKPISQDCPNMQSPLKSARSKQSIQRAFECSTNALNNIQNQISLVSHQKQAKGLEDSKCGNCTHDDQNSKYILEIRQELAEQKQMLAELFQSIKTQTPAKRYSNTPQRNVKVVKYVYPAFTIVKSMSPVRL